MLPLGAVDMPDSLVCALRRMDWQSNPHLSVSGIAVLSDIKCRLRYPGMAQSAAGTRHASAGLSVTWPLRLARARSSTLLRLITGLTVRLASS